MRVIFIFVFVLGLVTDGLFIRVNAPVTPSLWMSFEGFKLSARHQPFMKGLRAHSEGIPFCARAGSSGLAILGVKSSQVGQRKSPVSQSCNGCCGSMVRGLWSVVRAGGRVAV